jgi:hypothetical protein
VGPVDYSIPAPSNWGECGSQLTKPKDTSETSVRKSNVENNERMMILLPYSSNVLTDNWYSSINAQHEST